MNEIAASNSLYVTQTGSVFDPARVQNLQGTRKMFKPAYIDKSEVFGLAETFNHTDRDVRFMAAAITSDRAVLIRKDQMAYHHIVQGIQPEPWMAAFCIICNSGVVFSPVVEQQQMHFFCGGVYDGMMLMEDKETGSWWDHITGECVHGKMLGKQLRTIGNLSELTIDEAQSRYPTCEIFNSQQPFWRRVWIFFQYWTATRGKYLFLPPGFRASMAETDSTLKEDTIGLGIWQGTEAIFIPKDAIGTQPSNTTESKIELTVFGEKISIRPNPQTSLPEAFYAAESDQPLQMISRWYGFSATFPRCEVWMPDKSAK